MKNSPPRLRWLWIVGALAALVVTIPAAAGAANEARVTVGTGFTPFPQNKQNEPTVAIDAARPLVLAAGSNDELDLAPCGTTIFATPDAPCPFTPGVGTSGVHFSFDGGRSWVQPTYTGWTARTGTPMVGPIGTLPWYYENDVVSGGDPAVAFGPVYRNGSFSWANGSRLYYANLVSNFPHALFASGAVPHELDEEEAPERAAALREQGFAEPGVLKGDSGIAVSRADNVTAANYNVKSTWMPPVIASKNTSGTEFSDKEQIWADNAESSQFFGNVYVCYVAFTGGGAGPVVVATSRDGGSTWDQQHVTAAAARSKIHFGQSGCTVRTNSNGVVYVMYQTFSGTTLPGAISHYLVRSYDGGTSWSKPQLVTNLLDNCFVIDPVLGRCVEDGIAGARNDLSGSPNVDIANGAPTGVGATNAIVDNYVTGPALNQERVYVRSAIANEQPTKAAGQPPALSWSNAVQVSEGTDRGYYTAPALSPNGSSLYVVYNAYTTPFQQTTATPRGLVGVFRTAAMTAAGPGAFTTLDRSPVGDPRASSQNDLKGEFLGDYVYADAMNDYGVGVWNDVRNGQDCPGIDAWRQALRTDPDNAGDPPIATCPPRFGETDIWSFTTH
jgi:hypothetical protein